MLNKKHIIDEQEDNRSFYITFANVISAISVVILHANGRFWSYSDESYWTAANVIECVFYYAVPVFFMITGITLIDYQKRYTTKTYFKKRLFKTVIPFLFWSCFGVLWNYRSELIALIQGKEVAGISLSFSSILDGIINTRFVKIYWFFIPLFCIYLTIPLFASIQESKKVKVFSYIVIISFSFNTVIPFLVSLLNRNSEIEYFWPIKVFVGLDYLSYVLLGYLLNKCDVKKTLKVIIYILSVFGLLIHILGTLYLSKKAGELSTFFKGYYNLPCVLYSTGVFVLLKDIGNKISTFKLKGFFIILQRYSFGIYLLHIFVLDILREAFERIGISYYSNPYVALATLTSIILCILVIMALRKIPILKKLLP